MEKDIGHSVIKTDNLKKFLARRRWQQCGQAIRAMKRMSSKLQLKKALSLWKLAAVWSGIRALNRMLDM